MSETRPRYGAAMGKDETLEVLTELKGRFERGEIRCAALRLFAPDGTWEDIAVGGSDEERAAALDDLRKSHSKAN